MSKKSDIVSADGETGANNLPAKNEFLRLISGKEEIIIAPTVGGETPAKPSSVFASICRDFVGWQVDEPGQPTPAIPVMVYEQTKDATLAQIFGLSGDLDKLCLTWGQIEAFARDHRQWLRGDAYSIFFLLKSRGSFFAVYVDIFSSGEFHAGVRRFENSNVWDADCLFRVVLPRCR